MLSLKELFPFYLLASCRSFLNAAVRCGHLAPNTCPARHTTALSLQQVLSNLPSATTMSSEIIPLDASAHPVKAVTIFQSSLAQLTRTFVVDLKATLRLLMQHTFQCS